MSLFKSIFGDPNKREVNKLAPLVQSVQEWEAKVQSHTSEQATARLKEIRAAVQGDSTALEQYVPEVFAFVRAAAQATIGLRHYDVQIIGGAVLHQSKIAEMKTGEGKTLMASLPLVLNALVGKGSHLVTVNDYLARRDAGWMGPVYAFLGLSVGVIVHEAAYIYDASYTDESHDDNRLRHFRPVSRREAYQADITYGTNNEFGFDYLRDNMVARSEDKVMRELYYAIVDEVDSILIDEARTPLIISAPAEESGDLYRRFASIIPSLNETDDYNVDEKMRAVTLTDLGVEKVERALGMTNIYQAGGIELVRHLEQALQAHALFKRDRDYVVKEGEVIIVDEFTGRLMHGRRYSEGLHQAIEAKENVPIKQESRTLATISFQNYFRLYTKLAGMTGTAVTEAEEFSKIYNLDVIIVPTNKPMVRTDMPDSIYKTELGKYQAIVREIKRRSELGQPVLVGTISIEKNELLSELLNREGITHEILNAKNHEQEAAIISRAGAKGAVTLATNIAGRGVDILLGGPDADETMHHEIVELGGLHVIGTERHESRRIDNQLRGRSGRQGDPGSTQFFISTEDNLMRIFGSERLKGLMDRLGIPDDMPIENRMVSRSIETAQRKVEGHNFDIRKHLVEYDDVMNKHREVIYKKRNEILTLDAAHLREESLRQVNQEIEQIVSFHTNNEDNEWDVDQLYNSVDALFTVPLEARIKLEDIDTATHGKDRSVEAREKMVGYLQDLATKAYAELEQRINDEQQMRTIERGMMLRTIDLLWIDHLDQMAYLRQGIGLRGYAQRDPLVEYKREAFILFTELLNTMVTQYSHSIYKVALVSESVRTPMQTSNTTLQAPAKTGQTPSALTPQQQVASAPAVSAAKKDDIGRNDACPCGSGKKYKKCGLLNTEEHQKLMAEKNKSL